MTMTTSQQPMHNLWQFVAHYLNENRLYVTGFIVVAIIWSIEISLSPFVLKKIYENMHANDKWMLIQYMTIYVGITLIMNVNFRVYNYLNYSLYARLKNTIRYDMLAYLLNHSCSYIESQQPGKLNKQLQDMSNYIEDLIQIPLIVFIPRISALIVAMTSIAVVVGKNYAILLAVWSIFFVGVSYQRALYAHKYSTKVAKNHAHLNGFVTECIYHALPIKIFDRRMFMLNKLNTHADTLQETYINLERYSLVSNALQSLLNSMLIGLMFTLMFWAVQDKQLDPGDAIFLISVIGSFSSAIFSLGQDILRFAKVIGYCESALGFMVKKQQEKRTTSYKKPKKHSITLENITYKISKNQTLLNHVNLHIKQGDKVGIIGYSGDGKSTILKLITRVTKPHKGKILIDNVDINYLTREDLASIVCMVPQNSALFSDSILENIRFARPSATNDEVKKAAKKALCYDFIDNLPHGIYTKLGAHGIQLSGGQLQRIALARVIIKNAPIVLFDEATSALDSITEARLQKAMNNYLKDKTLIAVAHKLNTLENMNKLVVIEEGSMVIQDSLSKLALYSSKAKKMLDLQNIQTA